MISPENATTRAIALTAVQRLRDSFQIVANFIQDPQRAINVADLQRKDDEKRSLKSASGMIERHRAKTSLMLSVGKSVELQQALNTLAGDVNAFQSAIDAEGDALLQKVLDTGAKTEKWQAHIRNCLNVISGAEKKILHPNGPAL